MFDGSREGSAGFGREVFGLFLLFWTLLILLSLFTYDPADPSLNHAVSGDPAIVNKAGLFGAYTAGLLNDIFGSASFFLPLALGGVGVSFISRGFHITWIRWIGFTLLSLCLLAVCASWDIPVGDLRGGGVAGWGPLSHALSLSFRFDPAVDPRLSRGHADVFRAFLEESLPGGGKPLLQHGG